MGEISQNAIEIQNHRRIKQDLYKTVDGVDVPKTKTKSFKITVPDWGLQFLKLSRCVNATREDTRQNNLKKKEKYSILF